MAETVIPCRIEEIGEDGNVRCETHGWTGLLIDWDPDLVELCPYAPVARGRTGGVALSVLPAISAPTVAIRSTDVSTMSGSRSTRSGTGRSATGGRSTTDDVSGSMSRTSGPSDGPPGALSGPWRTPINVRALASQANEVATRVLRGEFTSEAELRRVTVYASLVRTITQAMGMEVSHARFVKSEPVLEFDTESTIDPQSGHTEGGQDQG